MEHDVGLIRSILAEKVEQDGVMHPDEWVEVGAGDAGDAGAVSGVNEEPAAVSVPRSPALSSISPSTLQLIATLESDGYADKAICHACELTSDELVELRISGKLTPYRGEATRDRLEAERDLDGSWDQLESKAVASLKLELATPDMLSAGEKIAIARTANAAKRKRDRDAELEARRSAGLAGGDIRLTQNNVVQLSLPSSMIEHLKAAASRAVDLGADAFIERERKIAASISKDNAHVNFAQAGEILGVDFDEGSAGKRINDAEILEKTNSTDNLSGLIASSAG